MLNKFHGIRNEEYEKKEKNSVFFGKFRKKRRRREKKKEICPSSPVLTGRLELFSIINQCHASLVVAVESATRTTFTMTDDVQNYLLYREGGEVRRNGSEKTAWKEIMAEPVKR